MLIMAMALMAMPIDTYAQSSEELSHSMSIKEGEALTDSLFRNNCYIDVVLPEGVTPGKYSMTEEFDIPSSMSAGIRIAILRFKLSCKLENEWKIVTDATAEDLNISQELYDGLMADLKTDNMDFLKALTEGVSPREDLLTMRSEMVGKKGREHAYKYFTFYHRPFS